MGQVHSVLYSRTMLPASKQMTSVYLQHSDSCLFINLKEHGQPKSGTA